MTNHLMQGREKLVRLLAVFDIALDNCRVRPKCVDPFMAGRRPSKRGCFP